MWRLVLRSQARVGMERRARAQGSGTRDGRRPVGRRVQQPPEARGGGPARKHRLVRDGWSWLPLVARPEPKEQQAREGGGSAAQEHRGSQEATFGCGPED